MAHLQTTDGRSITTWVWEIYKKRGIRGVVESGTSFGSRILHESLVSISPIDDYCYGHSLKTLESMQDLESDVDSIIETAYEFSGRGHYSSIRPEQSREELQSLIKHLKQSNLETIVELGSYRGGTFYTLIRCLQPKHAVSIDLTLTEMDSRFFSRFSDRVRTDCLSMNSQSQKTVDELTNLLDQSVDFLFIDADHRYEGVKADWSNYKGIVSEGGIVAFHDIQNSKDDNWIEVPRLWEEIQDSHETREFSSEGAGGGIGLVYL